MAQTLTAYIIEKATNSRSAARQRGGSGSTLTGSIVDKFFKKNNKKSIGGSSGGQSLTGFLFDYIKNNEKNKKSFLADLEHNFDILSHKTENIKIKLKEQKKLYKRSSSITEEITKKSNNIFSLLERRSELERTFFELSIQGMETIVPPAVTTSPVEEDTTEEPITKPVDIQPEPQDNNKQWWQFWKKDPPQKKADGGIVSADNSLDDLIKKVAIDREERNKFAKTLQSPLRLSGLYSISVVGNFLQSSGSISAFLIPFSKSVIAPFAESLGVTSSEISRLVTVPLLSKDTDLRKLQSEFAKTWYDLMTNDRFINQFIDREYEDEKVDQFFTPVEWKEDPEFSALVNEFAQEWNLNPAGLLALMASESGIDPSRENRYGCVGLIQFCPGGGLPGTGKTAAELKAMTRSEQWPYVTNYWIRSGLEKGMTAGDIYGLTHYPNPYKRAVEGLAIGSPERMAAIVVSDPNPAYTENKRLDANQDGHITVGDYEQELKNVAKDFDIPFAEGGSIGDRKVKTMTPYVIEGPETGFPFTIQDGLGNEHDVTLHGREIVVPLSQGFEVYPIKNKKYDMMRQPEKTFSRWRSIIQESNSIRQNISAADGISVKKSPEFWQMAAIAAKEDTLHPQGQADVAQSIYNRAAIGTYPGGKNILGIITAPGQYEPTFKNPGDWAVIKDRKSAINAVGNERLVDMASKSISNKSLQNQAAKFVGGRTDFMGESQKNSMKPEDITRGKNHNFFGWFYDAKLTKPAPVPKMISSQTNTSVSPKPNKAKTKTFTIPFTDLKVPVPFLSSSMTNIPIYSETFNSRMTRKELELIRLG